MPRDIDMQCPVCRDWIPGNPGQVAVSTHYVGLNQVRNRCPGSGRRPVGRRPA